MDFTSYEFPTRKEASDVADRLHICLNIIPIVMPHYNENFEHDGTFSVSFGSKHEDRVLSFLQEGNA